MARTDSTGPTMTATATATATATGNQGSLSSLLLSSSYYNDDAVCIACYG